MTQLTGADGDRVEKFLKLRQPRLAGDNRPNPVTGQPIGFGEGIELNKRVLPIVLLKQVMRRARLRMKIAIGFIND